MSSSVATEVANKLATGTSAAPRLASPCLPSPTQTANAAKASPFFSLPLAANDSDPYSVNFAAYVVANLNPSLTCYIEFSSSGLGWMSTGLVRAPPRCSLARRAGWW